MTTQELLDLALWHETRAAYLMGTCDLISVSQHFETARELRRLAQERANEAKST